MKPGPKQAARLALDLRRWKPPAGFTKCVGFAEDGDFLAFVAIQHIASGLDDVLYFSAPVPMAKARPILEHAADTLARRAAIPNN